MAEVLVEPSGSNECWIDGFPLFLLFLIGAGKLLCFLYELISPFIIPKLNLLKRYGGGWALVTGGSEGMGFAIAEQLAKEGFNIILISRSKEKLQAAREKLLKVKSGIQVQVKSVDFERLQSEEDYRLAFAEYLKRDISILVNNVGAYYPRYFSELSFSELRRQIKLNLFPITLMSRLFIEKMLERPTKCGIINLSSIAPLLPYAANAHYAATKKFDDYLSLALNVQYGHKIDFLTVRPSLLTTKLTNFTDSIFHSKPEYCAKRVVSSLGRRRICYGTFLHTFQGVGTSNVNDKVLEPVYTAALADFKKRYNEAAK